MEYKHYTLSVTQPEYWQEIHNQLCHESECEHVPNRCVECSDEKEHSQTRGTFLLSEEEVQELLNHPNVKWIELSPIHHPEVYPTPVQCTKRWPTDVKIYRDLNTSISPTPTPEEINRTNWAIKRTVLQKSSDFWTQTGEFIPPVLGNVDYTIDGSNTDIIIQDSGVLQYHPEFLDSTGKSRVRDVILDGPYYIDPVYFNINGLTTIKPDGRIGITELAAKNWWQNSSLRSPQFSSIGTFTIPAAYNENDTLGTNLDGSNGLTDSHGTSCASLSAGKNFGTAFNANIWSIYCVSRNRKFSVPIELTFDLMKVFHLYKPINPATGIKNPTIISGSWVYLGGFDGTTVVSYSFEGQVGTFIGNSPAADPTKPVLYAKESLTPRPEQYRNYVSSSRSASTDLAGSELMDSGAIFVASAGNSNQRLGIGLDDPHLLDYFTDIIFPFDPNPEFPAGTIPSGHRNWLTPSGMGYDSVADFHPVICVGAMDDFSLSDGAERKAFYSNNGPGVDVWAPADETLAAGIIGLDPYVRADNGLFRDCLFNGTSAAAPVVAGIVAIHLQLNPTSTSSQVKDWLFTSGSVTLTNEYLDQYPDPNTLTYWSGRYNMRGAEKRIIYNPYSTFFVPPPPPTPPPPPPGPTPPPPPPPPGPTPPPPPPGPPGPAVDDIYTKLTIEGDGLSLFGISIE